MKVSEAIKRVEADGCQLRRMRGSHRQYAHTDKPGIVTIAGKPSIDLPPGTARNILRQAGLLPEREGGADVCADSVIVIEKGPTSHGAWCPDLPGVVAAADTEVECVALMREAITFHIEGLIETGQPVPPPTMVAAHTVHVDAA